jgi:hypothetical protein
MNDVTDQDSIIENMRKAALPTSPNNLVRVSKVYGSMTENHMSFFGNTPEEKDVILHHLQQKYLKVKNTPEVVYSGGKNLLYFSIFLSDAYVDLLYMCLNSILKNTPNINFDILFITDETTKAKIESFDIISKFNVDYLISSSVGTGPLASLKKLNIFDYEKIAEYSKILLFDADIICINDLNIIFEKNLDPEFLYVCSTEIHKSPLLLSPTHGLMYLSKQDASFINENPDVIPFNAGQFLFLNSLRMREHFKNVRWLKNVWPGEYFYEQSFMNYYFVLRSLTKPLTRKITRKVLVGVPTDHSLPSLVDKEFEEQLISVTFNRKNYDQKTETQLLDFVRIKMLARSKKIMTVTGAINSSFSKTAINKYTEIPEGVLNEPLLMHNEHTVAIHFAATLSSGVDKKTFINIYANAHKLHI